ncbi:MAG: hypothetical protein GJ680_05800 [Alteromonadaceae bacterium]|nr:hypothetical protein [Alteromonadaceae bacterium]
MKSSSYLSAVLFAAFASFGANAAGAHSSDLKSYWLKDIDGNTMLDPQTSGLAVWRNGTLLTIADGSADDSQTMRIIQLDPNANQVLSPKVPISLAKDVSESCFGGYLSGSPDLEAIAVDPKDDNIIYSVTEDASRYQWSSECIDKYAGSGSTEFPTVLVRIELQSDKAIMTGARPLQFAKEMNIGNHPNDGIEGITFAGSHELYIALEKDDAGKARIFTVSLSDEFWKSSSYYPVTDANLALPEFKKGNHPINALTYVPVADSKGYLVAAARNDNQLWFLDLERRKPVKVVQLNFLAESLSKDNGCKAFDQMHNYSIEGLAYDAGKVWLVNDPWKINYLNNVKCKANAEGYKRMSPLLTYIDVDFLTEE